MTVSNHEKVQLENLSASEQQLFDLLMQGMNTSEISKYLSMSYSSVAEMNARIMSRLQVKSVKELKQLAGLNSPAIKDRSDF